MLSPKIAGVVGVAIVAAGAIYIATQCGTPPSPAPPPTPAPTYAPAPTPAPVPTAASTATPFPPTPVPTLERIVATPMPVPSPTPFPTATAVPLPTQLPPTATAAPAPTYTAVPKPAATPAAAFTPARPAATATPHIDELVTYFNGMVEMAGKGQTVGVAFYNDRVNGVYAGVFYRIPRDQAGKPIPGQSLSRTFQFSDERTLWNLATIFGATALPQSPLPTTPVLGGGSMAAYPAPSFDSTRDGLGQKVINALKTQQPRIIQAIKDGGRYVPPR